MSATMSGAAGTATAELRKGIPNRIIVETGQGRLITIGARPKALLIVTSDFVLGLILLRLEKAAEYLKELLIKRRNIYTAVHLTGATAPFPVTSTLSAFL